MLKLKEVSKADAGEGEKGNLRRSYKLKYLEEQIKSKEAALEEASRKSAVAEKKFEVFSGKLEEAEDLHNTARVENAKISLKKSEINVERQQSKIVNIEDMLSDIAEKENIQLSKQSALSAGADDTDIKDVIALSLASSKEVLDECIRIKDTYKRHYERLLERRSTLMAYAGENKVSPESVNAAEDTISGNISKVLEKMNYESSKIIIIQKHISEVEKFMSRLGTEDRSLVAKDFREASQKFLSDMSLCQMQQKGDKEKKDAY